MDDEQKVHQGCKAALIAIAQPEPTENNQSSEFTTLRTDFISILALLHAATTKVALSLKPTSPQYKASLTPLKELSNNVAALVHSIRLMQLTQAKSILKEYESVAKTTIRAIESFVQTVISSTSPDEYLRKTGEIHELIDNARKPGVLSSDNQAAVRKKWSQDYDSLQDGYDELKGICEQRDSGDDEGDEDGWDEMGFESNRKLSEEELERAIKMQGLIRLVVLLHHKVLKSILPSTKLLPNPVLDTLVDISDSLLSSADEVISSLYGTQNSRAIEEHTQSLLKAIARLKRILIPQSELSLEEQMAAVSISDSDEKARKWFTMCFDQIEQAGRRVISTNADSV
ncbi:hypothetical protein BJ165DRAFT_1607471 [Panaeolus papilionaceus]|nr:hypothetical protein BJ165DRAFT_1607471 [Panaeolus papilionaceus]